MSKTNRKPRSRAKPAASVPPFLHKIYEILENPCHQDLISWNQEGNAFIIKNVTEFTENVLPKYFKHSNFASFVRQLNLYDFHKSRYENNGSEFYHKLFKRDEKQLLSEIKRKMPNDNGSDSPSQFFYQSEEVSTEGQSSSSFQCASTLQDLINRQERLENAMKIVHTQNKQLIKENKMLWNEVTALKTKQGNTEKATRVLNGQNSQLIQKNSYLWNEMILNRERYERKVEKLMIFLISVLQCQGKNHPLFKKKNPPPRTGNGEEENSFDNIRSSNPENNNFSVLPVKQIIKHFGNKKGKTQLDKLLERLDEENLTNLFGNKPLTLDEKDCLLKLSSLLEVETGNANFSGLEFLADKRPHQLNRSFEEENPRDGSSKLCKLEYEDHDAALLMNSEERSRKELLKNSPLFERFTRDEKIIDMTSPMRIEDEFEMLSFHQKDLANNIEYDFIGGFDKPLVPFNRNNSFFANHFSEDEGDDGEEEVKKDSSFLSNKSLHKSHSASLLDFHTKNDSKLDEVFRLFSPTSFLNNHFNQENGNNQETFFNCGTNIMPIDSNN